ncbi:hypothetical protein ABEB36_008529 [Hypothenemus hampei]|uniref:E3 ubiquitin-protein ligase RNF10 n=1 Tax=Hypothenemus hampei TaxID=57062 RepID=A0ABD1EMB0_HYPHA
MDKKGNRSTQNSSRVSCGTDLKKTIDGSIGKQGSKVTPRRREPPCGFSKSTEPIRKQQSQRNGRNFDKRPKPRGYYYSGGISRNEETSIDFEEPELGSVFAPGSKKQSLNYLLNFTFAPRDNSQNSNERRQDGKWLTTRKHAYNKNHYLQANCQFIVNQKGDYKKYLSNPDELVAWNLIEQVNVQVDEEPACPICLYPPVAAKMTKCGHIYCWPCMLHYLALSDKGWRKCPICFDAVKKDDLKSVTVVPHQTYNINDTITFKLMKRLRGTFTAYPAESVIQLEDNNLYNISEKNDENGFSKLFLANVNNILEILAREDDELSKLMTEDPNCPEKCFMEEAKQLIISRRDVILADQLDANLAANKRMESSTKDKLTDLDCQAKADPNINEAEGGPHIPKFYYFYQAEDGQHLYLHAINAKMIEHTYGSLEFGPKSLQGKIVEKEGGSMTEDLRNKLRYLQHLPVTCQFEVAEIELLPPLISKETLEKFQEQLEFRKRKRHKREKEERRRERKIEVEENRKIGKYDSPILYLDNHSHFPDVNEAHIMFPDFLERKRTDSESISSITQSERSESPDPNLSQSLSLKNTYAGPSFATMLVKEKKPTWPILKKSTSTSQSSSTPVKLIHATGSNMAVPAKPRSPELESEQDCLCEVPSYSQSFGDALAEAMGKNWEPKENNAEAEVSGKKKKKNKRKLLFSTNMAYLGH